MKINWKLYAEVGRSSFLMILVAVLWGCSHIRFSHGQVIPPTDPAEIDALVAFRSSLTNSKKQLPSWYNNLDPCVSRWEGVICLQDEYPTALSNSSYSHITELRLLRKNLTGTLAPELGNLKALKFLDVMWNQIGGSIPDSFGNLTNMYLLLLNGNQLKGSLPESLGYLTGLNRIQIDENQISGPIPTSFQNLSSIQHLHMNNNSLSGSIPSELGKLPKMVHLLLDNNNLSGSLPPEIASAPNLLILQLDNNHFDDGTTLPREYFQIPTLLKLSLRNCNIVGDIPVSDMNSSQQLAVLDLGVNHLNGSIPILPTALTAIDLSNNDFAGAVPDQLGSLQNLSFVLMSNNRFSGAIPRSIGTAPIYNDSNGGILLDFQNNNISTILNNASLLALPDNQASFHFAGNPVCSGQNLAAWCVPVSGVSLLDTSFVMSSSNKETTCADNCKPPASLVPNAAMFGCSCAVPIIVWYRLKSPGFNVFDLYEREFLVYISSGLGLSINQVDIFDYAYEPGPRIQMHLHLFPATGYQFNQSECDRLNNLFGQWLIPDSPVFGPYELLRFTVQSPSSGGSKKLSGGAIAGIVVGVLVAAGALALIGILFLVKTKKSRRPQMIPMDRGFLSKIKATGLQEWKWEDMEQFTDKFNEKNVLGVGGYGKVYLGMLPDGSKVAIKRKRAEAGSSEQFQTEIELLSRVHHRNLVALKGFCQDDESGDEFLVYEFMENGTVEDHILPNTKSPLSFPTRLRIALGAARGLNYLHTEANPPIYHRDIKASNILLDKKFQAKVADFGVGKNAPEPDEEGGVGGGVDTLVRGTPGYLDPEYCLTHTLTDKSDVYSFGVFLMVLLAGRPAISQGKNIVRAFKMAGEADLLWSLVDTYIANQCSAEIAESWARLTLRCTATDPMDRPSMTDVVNVLDMIYKAAGISRAETDSSSTATFTNTSSTFTNTSSSTNTTTSEERKRDDQSLSFLDSIVSTSETPITDIVENGFDVTNIWCSDVPSDVHFMFEILHFLDLLTVSGGGSSNGAIGLPHYQSIVRLDYQLTYDEGGRGGSTTRHQPQKTNLHVSSLYMRRWYSTIPVDPLLQLSSSIGASERSIPDEPPDIDEVMSQGEEDNETENDDESSNSIAPDSEEEQNEDDMQTQEGQNDMVEDIRQRHPVWAQIVAENLERTRKNPAKEQGQFDIDYDLGELLGAL
ncbi:hypothetical protein R1sor_015877 [Riccia sorocarpa]|uniref:Protein kinase domain-containing protein n=1 Tax=Riccia sorocarpa TaxID=122646 RepID=A0ABD3HDF4_9MARC